MEDEKEEIRSLLFDQIDKTSMVAVAEAIGIGRVALTHFINGRLRKGVLKYEGLSFENDKKVRAYLRKECKWPPEPEMEGLKTDLLVRAGSPKPRPGSDREKFADALLEWGERSISYNKIQITGDGWARFYAPEGGLTEADYYFFASFFEDDEDYQELWATELATKVVMNILILQGFGYWKAKWAATRLHLDDLGTEEIERRGFDALVEQARSSLSDE